MPGFAGELAEPVTTPALRRILCDEIPATFQWLLDSGVRFMGPMPEPPHRQPRMHNVLPNSRSFIYHLGRRARRAGVDIRTGMRVTALVQQDGRVTGVDAEGAARPDALPRARRRGAGRRRLHQRRGLQGALHGRAGSQGGRREPHRHR